MRTGEQLQVFEGHDGPVYTARFNHDGSSFVTAGVDGKVQVWDVESSRGRCDLMREVWDNVPVIWESGRVVVRAIPADHECGAVQGRD